MEDGAAGFDPRAFIYQVTSVTKCYKALMYFELFWHQFNWACSEASLSQKTWRHSGDAWHVVARFAIVRFCFLPTCPSKPRVLRISKYTVHCKTFGRTAESATLLPERTDVMRPSKKHLGFVGLAWFSFDCRPITSCRTASRFCASLKWTPEPEDPWS